MIIYRSKMWNIIDYIEEPRFKSLMLELSKSNNSEDEKNSFIPDDALPGRHGAGTE